MMRKALVVGIDYYKNIPSLYGCVNDSKSIKAMLDQHADGSPNFNVILLSCTNENNLITRNDLKQKVEELFADDNEIALLYFAGHGHIEVTGGYLCTSDYQIDDNNGLSLHDIMTIVNISKAKNKIIILDSCYSGIVAEHPTNKEISEIADGVTILTASAKNQYASEEEGSGVFTTLLVNALDGGAANLVGDITPGSVYAHIDQSLGAWAQRPVFKTSVKKFISLRKVKPPLPLSELRRISEFFPSSDYKFQLDPSYEPEGNCPNPDNTKIFAILQRYNRVNLLVPVDAPHLYHAAMESKHLVLTKLGQHYRKLSEKKLI
jgi:hypothetical protein